MTSRPLAIDVKNTPLDNRYLIQLIVDNRNIGSKSTFKTCHNAQYYGQPLRPGDLSILGAKSLVAKRCFSIQPNTSDGQYSSHSQRHLARIPTASELPRMLDEANCLYWGTALMGMVYNLIDDPSHLLPSSAACASELESNSNSSSILSAVPRLRFVYCGLSVPVDGGGAVYLLEEAIDAPFTKYVLNNSLSPMPGLKPAQLRIATFLCFAQHAQYLLSEGKIFLSDFQGGGELLTDPQVITSDEYSNKFGQGNLSEVLDNFETLHVCNAYCHRFLPRNSFSRHDGSVDSKSIKSMTTASDMDLGTREPM
ncbi:hypothetical protein BC835DRAFT_1288283 [Cytidiella melzeri]|nr:hypothetical protein BC835DRAFT_1288283 [Cytidiella melzeri]